jgi:hypothetical protein
MEQKRVAEIVTIQETNIEEKFRAMELFSSKIKETMDKTVNDIFAKSTADEKLFTVYERKFKLIDVSLLTLKKLNMNMDEIMR